MPAYRDVKYYDLDQAPDYIRDAIRPIALAHVSTIDAMAIWEVTVGRYDWQDATEEWALHRWLRENGAADAEMVLLKLE